jgi:hypothetical protein
LAAAASRARRRCAAERQRSGRAENHGQHSVQDMCGAHRQRRDGVLCKGRDATKAREPLNASDALRPTFELTCGRQTAQPAGERQVQRRVRTPSRVRQHEEVYRLHHCCSQGTPSLFPSIFTPGQLRRKNVASAQEVICEQWVRPSHLKETVCVGAVVDETAGAGEAGVPGSSKAAGGAERERKCW